ncbi:CBN-NUD-2 protein [Caenorhabditis brenneri]|uniref:CBN-NUD-2 protein n=1 Tax=Caenorhabditis brenneri TaxID=135651 RepID=G0P727_CAEBE|nr:CBN-NUD-2 protein [Caenorhabditis brenneri]
MDLSDDQIRALPHHDLVNYFLQMREEFNEFQSSSSEIEKMMDAELDDLKAQLKRSDGKIQQLTTEQMRNKDRQDESRTQWCQVEEQLRRENGELREQCERQRERIRKLEQRNDVLETSDRNKEYLASDLGTKLDSAIEKIAMLESELYERQVAVEEMHRLREEQLRTTTERPRLIVEPLRNDPEILPDEPSPGPSKEAFRMSIDDVYMEDVQHHHQNHHNDDVRMEETITKIDQVSIDDNKNIQEKQQQQRATSTGGAGACINRIVKDLMTKVERLDSILSTIRVTNSSNNNNANHHLTTTRA